MTESYCNFLTTAALFDPATALSSTMDAEMFQIVFWSSLVLILVLVLTIITLTSMDNSKDTLLYANDKLKTN